LQPWALAAADLNGDGKLDLAVVNSGSNTVTILANEGKAVFQTHATFAVGKSTVPFTVGVADFNGDHIPDLAVSDFGSNTASIFLGKGAGKFKSPVTYTTGFSPAGLSIGDFNGDGLPDLAMPTAGSNAVSILLDQSNGTFESAPAVATGQWPLGIATGDFNGDGNLDLVTTNDDVDTVSVALGNGRGGFSSHVDYQAGLYPVAIVIADFNLDGKLDVVTANTGADTVSVLLGKGDGTFQPALTFAAGNVVFQMVEGDFNHDGKPDLALANNGTNTVSILLGNGDGTFQPSVDYPINSLGFGIVTGDFNSDGALDLAVTSNNCNTPASNCLGTISVLLGNGDGTFQPRVDYPGEIYPAFLTAADLNGNGGTDLVVPDAYLGTVSVMLNLPVIGVFPNALNFGSGKVGVKSTPQTITIGNPSGTPITVKKPTISGADASDFAQTTTCPLSPATLAPGLSCSVVVTFTPKATGSRTATLKITDSVPGSSQLVGLGGMGQ
jgi:hypothetical protein